MRNPAFVLRDVTPADDAAVASIIRTVMPTFGCSGEGFAIHDPEVNGMSAAYAKPGCRYWVVEREGRVVGGGGIAPLEGGDGKTCEVRKMYFLEEARGHGLGAQLLTKALATAKDLGYTTVYLETMSNMTDARKLYERNGFHPLTKPMGNTGHFGCNSWYAKTL